MPVFSTLLTADVRRALNLNYEKIKTQCTTYGPANRVVKTYNFPCVYESAPFQIDDFITALRRIQNHFHINFSIGCMLWEEMDVRYFYPSFNNLCCYPRLLE